MHHIGLPPPPPPPPPATAICHIVTLHDTEHFQHVQLPLVPGLAKAWATLDAHLASGAACAGASASGSSAGPSAGPSGEASGEASGGGGRGNPPPVPRPFILGDAFTFADVTAGISALRFFHGPNNEAICGRLGPELRAERFPHCAAWFERLRARPAFAPIAAKYTK